jgi:iron complex outermembrane receptor protein
LYEGEVRGQFNSDVDDPVYCPQRPNDVSFCKIRPLTRTGGNANLKPEKSRQNQIGFVVAPSDMFTGSIDMFQVEVRDRISIRTAAEILANYQSLGELIVRNPQTNVIDYVRAGWVNVAGDKVRGADISLAFNFRTDAGRVTAKLDGTYFHEYLMRKTSGDRWVQRVGEFGDSNFLWDLKLRWKHNASVSWTRGDWSATLSQDYKSAYRDEVDGYGSGVILQNRGFQTKVSSYSLFNVSVSYTGIRNMTLTAGVKNIFDSDPPFTFHNVDNVAGAGWDARVGDPRGRAFTLRANYKFW